MFPPQVFKMIPRRPSNYSIKPIKSLEDIERFFNLATQHSLGAIWSIELTLNANDFCDYRDDLLAMAFRQFHPAGSRNPHNIYKITVKVQGTVLFARQTYTTISPAASWDVDKRFEGLLTDQSTLIEKEDIPFGVISQEKAFVPALLGIRGVHEVEVTGMMEPGLKEEIMANLRTAVGAPVPQPPSRGPVGINGVFWSASYDRKRVRDGDYNPYAPKDPGDSNEEIESSLRTRLRRSTTAKSSANPYRIETLKRIAAKPQDGDDYGIGNKGISQRHYEYMDLSDNPEERVGEDWIVPTGKGARCVMGWNAVGGLT